MPKKSSHGKRQYVKKADILEFVSITGAAESEARKYLKTYSDINQSVESYFSDLDNKSKNGPTKNVEVESVEEFVEAKKESSNEKKVDEDISIIEVEEKKTYDNHRNEPLKSKQKSKSNKLKKSTEISEKKKAELKSHRKQIVNNLGFFGRKPSNKMLKNFMGSDLSNEIITSSSEDGDTTAEEFGTSSKETSEDSPKQLFRSMSKKDQNILPFVSTNPSRTHIENRTGFPFSIANLRDNILHRESRLDHTLLAPHPGLNIENQRFLHHTAGFFNDSDSNPTPQGDEYKVKSVVKNCTISEEGYGAKVPTRSFNSWLQLAETQRLWLIIFIYDSFNTKDLDDFRDALKMDLLKEIVENNFCIWHADCHDTEGHYFMGNYAVKDVPFVSIIEPLTGAMRLKITEFKDINDFCDTLMKFLEKNGKPHSEASLAFAEEDLEKKFKSSLTTSIDAEKNNKKSKRQVFGHTDAKNKQHKLESLDTSFDESSLDGFNYSVTFPGASLFDILFKLPDSTRKQDTVPENINIGGLLSKVKSLGYRIDEHNVYSQFPRLDLKKQNFTDLLVDLGIKNRSLIIIVKIEPSDSESDDHY